MIFWVFFYKLNLRLIGPFVDSPSAIILDFSICNYNATEVGLD